MSEKLVFLYAGQKPSGVHYNTYTDAEIAAFTDGTAGVNEFVITPGNREYYPQGTTVANLESKVSTLIDDMLDIAAAVLRNPGHNIWFGTPHIPAPTATMTLAQYATGVNSHANLVKKFIDIVKSRYNTRFSNGFNARVRGFYMNHEHLNTLPYDAGQVALNYNNLTAHPEVAMFDAISQHVQITLGRSFIWVPFFGVGGYYMTIIKDIGYIANRTNIFNIVFLQPQYYFGFPIETTQKTEYSYTALANLAAIHESMRLNRVVYRKNASGVFPEVCSKTSSTLIGCQMETDESVYTDTTAEVDADKDGNGYPIGPSTTHLARQNKYIDTFSDYSGNRPISYYCGDKINASHFASLANTVRAFYS